MILELEKDPGIRSGCLEGISLPGYCGIMGSLIDINFEIILGP